MPITFSINQNDEYSVARYKGKITDAELIEAYKYYYQWEEWYPGLNELIDVSEADVTEITIDGLRKLADFAAPIHEKHKINPAVAVYAPKDLSYGLARVYSVNAKMFEKYEVFRNIIEAEEYLKKARGI